MSIYNEIFFSYAWADGTDEGINREKIVDELYSSLKTEGYKVIRDKHDLDYKGFISDFIKEIGSGKNIIIAISKKYLQSPYCMFELYEIARNSKFEKNMFRERVYPIMIEFIDFNKPAIITEYLTFWENQLKEWDNLIITKSSSLSTGQFKRYENIKMIKQNFGMLSDWLIDMNTLNLELLSNDNFSIIKKDIQRNLKLSKESKKKVKFLLKRIPYLL